MSNSLTQHFFLEEFHSKDGTGVPVALLPNITQLAEALEVVRSFYHLPMVVTSGFRSADHNRAVRGAAGSWHLRAMAADVHCPSVPHRDLYRVFVFCMDNGIIPLGGLSLYSWGIHYDTRGFKVFW